MSLGGFLASIPGIFKKCHSLLSCLTVPICKIGIAAVTLIMVGRNYIENFSEIIYLDGCSEACDDEDVTPTLALPFYH